MTGGISRQGEDRRSGPSVARVLGVPLALAVLSAIGLISALLGDGAWDMLSWLALGFPVAVTTRYLAREFVRARARRGAAP